MANRDDFWSLDHLSDTQLLASLGGVLRNQRRSLAEVVAHLGEVEDRRLHLEAACGSMFTYCVARLGMSEAEACRRIELARLARKFPALFAELDSGQITLSVALVLKPILSPSNHLELLAAARGKCVRQARELVAERFPKTDAPSKIRKLPERRPLPASDGGSAVPSPAASDPLPSLFATTLTSPSPAARAPLPAPTATTLADPCSKADLSATMPALPDPASPAPTPIAPMSAVTGPSSERFALAPLELEGQAGPVAPGTGSAPLSPRTVIEPLSAQRYRIQFTADAGLKQKLELARELLRHAYPNGDFAAIVARALDLLIDDVKRRRFGAEARRKGAKRAAANLAHAPSPAPAPASAPDANPSVSENAPSTPASKPVGPACSSTTANSTSPSSRSAYVPRAARRVVLERDGLSCTWADADGVRCGNQAWLEFDHRQPAGKGGSSGPENVRLLCRAHNLLAAEHAYGRDHIERCVRRRERAGARRSTP